MTGPYLQHQQQDLLKTSATTIRNEKSSLVVLSTSYSDLNNNNNNNNYNYNNQYNSNHNDSNRSDNNNHDKCEKIIMNYHSTTNTNHSNNNNKNNSTTTTTTTTSDDDDNNNNTYNYNNNDNNDYHPFMNGDIDHVLLIEPPHDGVINRRSSFIYNFVTSNGPPQIILLILFMAIGFGSVIGVVPAIMTDRYARLYHNYTNIRDCSDYNNNNHHQQHNDATNNNTIILLPNDDLKPYECILGSSDAQNAVAIENLISNLLTFVSSSYIGSISDIYGRKKILILSMVVCTMRPVILVCIQLYPTFPPVYYYIVGSISGLLNWIAIAMSSLSDVMPKKWRAPSFGLLLAGFSLGFAIAPTLAILLGHYYVSLVSLFMIVSGLFVTIFFLPETVSPIQSQKAYNIRQQQMESIISFTEKVRYYIYRPIWELSILNRNTLFRLLTALAFFSGIVSSADQTLLIYYIEERLNFNDNDIAKLFLVMGCLGIFIQGIVLKYLNDLFGERIVIIIAFTLGCICNILYGLANTKTMIYLGTSISAFVGMSFPTISAIKANNVEGSEQGRIQGALYSVSALASAVGPMLMRFVYHYTKDGAFMGPGSMFLLAAAIYTIAIYCAYALPIEANSTKSENEHPNRTPLAAEVDSFMVDDSDTEIDSSNSSPSSPTTSLLI